MTASDIAIALREQGRPEQLKRFATGVTDGWDGFELHINGIDAGMRNLLLLHKLIELNDPNSTRLIYRFTKLL